MSRETRVFCYWLLAGWVLCTGPAIAVAWACRMSQDGQVVLGAVTGLAGVWAGGFVALAATR